MAADAIADLIRAHARSFTSGDVRWVERHVEQSADLRVIGTAPGESLAGEEAFSTFRKEAAAADGTLSAEVSDVEAFSDGDVGWGSAQVTFRTATGMVARARSTMVFRNDGDTWRLVQLHTSVPVPDEAAFEVDAD